MFARPFEINHQPDARPFLIPELVAEAVAKLGKIPEERN